jgi:rod shape-determining protein MreC
MQNLIDFIRSYYHVMLFMVLETIGLYVFFSFNGYQRHVALSSSNAVIGSVYTWKENVTGYFGLREQNEELLQLNKELLAQDKNQMLPDSSVWTEKKDTSGVPMYSYLPCKIIETTVRKPENYLTLNIGSHQGVKKGMGVISPQGIVGKVVAVGKRFSMAMSIYNSNFRLTPDVADKTMFNELRWKEGSDRMIIVRVPDSTSFERGDAVASSRYGVAFPEGITIGRIEKIEKSSNSEFYEIIVEPAADMTTLREAYVVGNIYQEELDSLKTQIDEAIQ